MKVFPDFPAAGRRLGALVGGLAALSLAGAIALPASGRTADAAPSVEVRIERFAFDPPSLTVAQGTTVEWVNRDATVHSVMESGRQFRSPPLDTDDRFSRTFTEPGTFTYFCTLHPHMTGTIVVTGG